MSRSKMIVVGAVVVTAALAIMTLGVAVAGETQETLQAKDLPKAVADAVEAACPGGEIVSVVKETERERGKVEIEYEIGVKLKDNKTVSVEIETNESGKIVEIEVRQSLAVKDLPKAAADAVKKRCPGGEIVSVVKETETEKGKVEIEYEIQLKLQGSKTCVIEIEMTKDGKIAEIEVKDDDDDDDDDGDDDDDDGDDDDDDKD